MALHELLWVGGVALVVAAAAAGLARLLAVRLGFLDRPGTEAHKQQTRAVPYGGGFAMAIGLGVALACCDAAIFTRQFIALLAGGAALLAVGAWDDRRALTARVKLVVQGLVAVAVVAAGDLRIDVVHQVLPGAGHAAACLWLIAVTNAYNLIDHADGISGTVGIISALTLAAGAVLGGSTVAALPWAALAGALAGFWCWNRPPAAIYLGDAGSMPLGFLLGGGALMVDAWHPSAASPLALLAPLLVVAIPLFDSMVVVIKRLRRGRPIMRGDRNHISHRLGRLGLGPWATMLTIGALHLALAAGALQLQTATLIDGLTTLVQAMGVMVAVLLLETMRDDGV